MRQRRPDSGAFLDEATRFLILATRTCPKRGWWNLCRGSSWLAECIQGGRASWLSSKTTFPEREIIYTK